jgi:hypothetical protein
MKPARIVALFVAVSASAAERDGVAGADEAHGGAVSGLSRAGSHDDLMPRDRRFAHH